MSWGKILLRPRLGDGLAIGDLFTGFGDGLFDDDVGDDLFGDLESGQDGDTVFEESGQGAGELAEEVEFGDFAEDGEFEFGFVNAAAAFGRGAEADEEDGHREKNPDHESNVNWVAEEVAEGDEHLSHHGQLDVHALENGQEARQHEGHEEDHDADADHQDEGGIDEGGGELGLDLSESLEVIGHAAQDIHHGAAGLPGANHVDIEVGEHTGLLGHRVGEAAALHNVLAQRAADLDGDALGFEVRHAVERDGQGHAGIDEVGQLLGECR